eukprot:TRINITY_DN6684_c0_g1_i1.p1 TRINITY_DN6684_c0_g1~~TRINITY_DN6684_c0_g1_i1.p1  ORF type:complete len:368 (+),score=80.85 TRINITY_DN6684_c0_g1_i1:55-1104(+)
MVLAKSKSPKLKTKAAAKVVADPVSPPKKKIIRKIVKRKVSPPKKQGDKPAPPMTEEDKSRFILKTLESLEERARVVGLLEQETFANEVKIQQMQDELKKLAKYQERDIEQKRKKTNTIGVIRIDYDYPAIPGDVDWAGTFKYKTRAFLCPKLTFEMAQMGSLNKAVKANLRDCVDLLEESECVGITGDCGFMQHYQDFVGGMTKMPVFLSSLMQCSALASAFQKTEKILVLTANSVSLNNETLSELLTTCHLKKEVHDRFVIMGCQDLDGFDAVAKGDRVDRETVLPSLLAKVDEHIKADPNIKAILLECTELPTYGDDLRQTFKVPVFDAITLIDYFFAVKTDNPNF